MQAARSTFDYESETDQELAALPSEFFARLAPRPPSFSAADVTGDPPAANIGFVLGDVASSSESEGGDSSSESEGDDSSSESGGDDDDLYENRKQAPIDGHGRNSSTIHSEMKEVGISQPPTKKFRPGSEIVSDDFSSGPLSSEETISTADYDPKDDRKPAAIMFDANSTDYWDSEDKSPIMSAFPTDLADKYHLIKATFSQAAEMLNHGEFGEEEIVILAFILC